MSKDGRGIGQTINLSRQRGQTLIFIAQEGRQIDVNVMSQVDVLAIKELTEISREFERRELRPFMDKARAALSTLRGDRRPWAWVHSEKTGSSDLVKNQLPSFWRPALSRAFAQGPVEPENGGRSGTLRKGKRSSIEELRVRAQQMRAAGFSYGQIAEALSISKSTAWNLVNGDRPPDSGQI